MKIGFVGLGIMGLPMAKNLIKAGHELTVYDLGQDRIDALVKEGAKAPAAIGSRRRISMHADCNDAS